MPLHDQCGGQWYEIKQSARLINQRAHHQQTERHHPLAKARADRRASPVSARLRRRRMPQCQERRDGIRPADRPAGNDLRGRDKGDQYRETQAGVDRPAERPQATKSDQRDCTEKQRGDEAQPLQILNRTGLSIRGLQQPAVNRTGMRGTEAAKPCRLPHALRADWNNRRAGHSREKWLANRPPAAPGTAPR